MKILYLQTKYTPFSTNFFPSIAFSGAHAREDFPDRDDENFMKHTLSYWDAEKNECKLDYRAVHQNTLDDEVKPFPPAIRSY